MPRDGEASATAGGSVRDGLRASVPLVLPTAAVGTLRQRSFGNVRLGPALIVGAASIAGVELGVQIATRVDETHIRRAFGVMLLVVAARLAFRDARGARRYPDGS